MPDKSKALDLISTMAEFRVANEYYKQFNEIAENFLNPKLSFKTYNHFFSRRRTKGKTLNKFTTDFLDSLSTISRFENKLPSVEAELADYDGGFVSKTLSRMVQMKEAKGEKLSPQEQLVSDYLKGSQIVIESKIRRKELQERRQELMDKLDAYEKSKVKIAEEKKPAEEQIADIESDLAEALEEIDNRLVEIEAELEALNNSTEGVEFGKEVTLEEVQRLENVPSNEQTQLSLEFEQTTLNEIEAEQKAILEQEKEQLELEKIRLNEEAKFGINFIEKVLDNFDQQAESNNLTLEEQAELQNIDNELAEDLLQLSKN